MPILIQEEGVKKQSKQKKTSDTILIAIALLQRSEKDSTSQGTGMFCGFPPAKIHYCFFFSYPHKDFSSCAKECVRCGVTARCGDARRMTAVAPTATSCDCGREPCFTSSLRCRHRASSSSRNDSPAAAAPGEGWTIGEVDRCNDRGRWGSGEDDGVGEGNVEEVAETMVLVDDPSTGMG